MSIRKRSRYDSRRSRRRDTASDAGTRVFSIHAGEDSPSGVFAVDFPQLCAELGALAFLQVVLQDPVTGQLMSLRPGSKEEASPGRKSTALRRSRVSSTSPARTASLVPHEVQDSVDSVIAGSATAATILSEGTRPSSVGQAGETIEEDQESIPAMPTYSYVIISYEDDKTQTNLKTIAFKGFPMENAIISALEQCHSRYPTLSTITIKKCELTTNHIKLLTSAVNKGPNMREVYIDDNVLPEQSYDIILRQCKMLEILSLRGCKIDNEGAQLLADQLSWKMENSLAYLNLSTNMIDDKGAIALANALRTNRKLIALTLSGNYIADDGAIALADVAAKFQLTDGELIERKVMTAERMRRYIQMMDNDQVKRFSEVFSFNEDASRKGRSTKARTSQSEKPHTQSVVISLPPQDNQNWKTIDEEMGIQKHPFMQDVVREGGKIWCHGNFILTHINLSYNKVTTLGVQRFLQVVCYQMNPKTQVPWAPLPALTKIILEGNPIPTMCTEYSQLKDLLARYSKPLMRSSSPSTHIPVK